VRRWSVANAMDISPEGAPVEGAKAGGRHVNASAQVEHDEAVGESAHLEGDLPRIVVTEMTALHAFPYYVQDQVGGGGATGLEVSWVAAGPFARLKEHEFEEPRVPESVIEINIPHLHEPLLNLARETLAREPGSKFRKTIVRQGIEEVRSVPVVAIDRHGSDTRGPGYPAHGHGLGPFLVQQAAAGNGYSSSGGACAHVYTVYLPVYDVYIEIKSKNLETRVTLFVSAQSLCRFAPQTDESL